MTELCKAVAACLSNKDRIEITAERHHNKASESYLDVVFKYGRVSWEGSIPFQYRRLGLFLEEPQDIAELIDTAYESLEPKTAEAWKKAEKLVWVTEHKGKAVTKEFFDKLIDLEWKCIKHDLPANPNWARRTQDIKEMGYMLATDTNRPCAVCEKKTTQLVLIPLERGAQTGYEFISPSLRKRVLKVLKGYNAFEAKVQANTNSLIPDHKFPEISWDEKVKQEDLDNLTDEEIINKFQLLDNQRNLQKRESNRATFQTGKRGTIFGIRYYYEGDEDWPPGVPKTGKEAERGWIGSPWYDIERWRSELNKDLERLKKMDETRTYIPKSIDGKD